MSLWFAVNAIFDDLRGPLSLSSAQVGWISLAVHFGFIIGTLCFAYFAISDRYPARMVYSVCAMLGAAANLLILYVGHISSLLLLRVFTGVLLAGIHPVGMKVAFGWYPGKIGRIMGYLLGAFAVGTALPYLLKALGAQFNWRMVIVSISILSSVCGALMLGFIPDGSHLPTCSSLDRTAIVQVFRNHRIRTAAAGYIGHMWELYSFWVFIPFYINAFTRQNSGASIHVEWWTFLVIAVGCVGCVLGGLLSERFGHATVARVQLSISGMCCLISPVLLNVDISKVFFLSFVCTWGLSVIGDSPQFLALVAKGAHIDQLGTTLTIVNCAGFLTSLISIFVIDWLYGVMDISYVFLFLVPGPLLGLVGFSSKFLRQSGIARDFREEIHDSEAIDRTI